MSGVQNRFFLKKNRRNSPRARSYCCILNEVDILPEKQKTKIISHDGEKAQDAQGIKEEGQREEAKAEIDHVLVPRHEVLPDEEAKELFLRLNIKTDQLPKISITDPAVQHLGPRIGNIIRISRNSATAGTTTYYRIVIESENIAQSEE